MVCEHEYMNISPPPPSNYRACYGPDAYSLFTMRAYFVVHAIKLSFCNNYALMVEKREIIKCHIRHILTRQYKLYNIQISFSLLRTIKS